VKVSAGEIIHNVLDRGDEDMRSKKKKGPPAGFANGPKKYGL
jgi:hypothetical protein